MNGYEETLNRLIGMVLRRIDMHKDTPDAVLEELIRDCVKREGEEDALIREHAAEMENDIRHAICRYGILQTYLEDPEVDEIMVNGTEPIYVEKRGRLEVTKDHFLSTDRLEDIIRRIVAGCNRMVNEAMPIVDARLPGGERVCAIVGSIAVGGPYLTIRKFSEHQYGLSDLIGLGSLSTELAAYLKAAVEEKQSIVVSGATGSGKTTLLSALSTVIPVEERVICIEDNVELKLGHLRNLVRLETRNPNAEGKSGVSIRELFRASLRMRPDRIIVGEVRGSEVLDMLQAMNTGHAGSLSTVHANSAADALVRLETMALMDAELPLAVVRRQIASGVHLIAHLSRNRDGKRAVTQVIRILGICEGEIRFETIFDSAQDKASVFA